MSNFRDILKVEGVMAKGFGLVPKMVMLDRKLTIEAKAIYNYFRSYAGAGSTAFPSVDKIVADLGISKTRYYKHLELLKKYDYIRIEQVKDEKSKFSHNVYTLIEKPNFSPCTHFEDTAKKPCTSFEYTENPYTENEYYNNNKSLYNNNKSFYNDQSVIEESQDGQMDSTTKTEEELAAIKENIITQSEIELYQGEARELLENAVSSLLKEKSIRIDNALLHQKEIIELLTKLNLSSCDYALNKFTKIQEKQEIKNKFKYFKTILLSSITEAPANYIH